MGKIKERYDRIPITVKASSAYAISSILQRCLSFITLPLFTRLLTTEQYGQLTIYQSWTGILSIFLTLNLAYGSFSTAMTKFENDRDGYIASVEGICLALSGVFLLVYLPFSGIWNKLFELPTAIMCVMVLELLGTTAIQLWSGKKRFEFKYKSIICITLGMAVVSPILAYLLVINSDEKGYARILGYSLISIIVGGFFYIRNAVKGRKIVDKGYWKFALGFNVPLLAYYLSQVIFNQSDRIMISHMIGKDKAAVYGVAYSLATILTFVLNAINNSYVPWYYGKIKEGKQEENKAVSLGIALLMAILLSGVIWFAPEIIFVLAGEKYAEAVYVIAPVAISILLLFYSQLFINFQFYFEEKKKLVWASIGAAVINLILNWVFIRMLGFVAAAYTTLVSYIVFAFSNYKAMKQILEKRKIEDKAFNYKGLITVFVLFCFLSFLGVLMYRWLIVRICIVVGIALILISQHKKIIGIYKLLKE